MSLSIGDVANTTKEIFEILPAKSIHWNLAHSQTRFVWFSFFQTNHFEAFRSWIFQVQENFIKNYWLVLSIFKKSLGLLQNDFLKKRIIRALTNTKINPVGIFLIWLKVSSGNSTGPESHLAVVFIFTSRPATNYQFQQPMGSCPACHISSRLSSRSTTFSQIQIDFASALFQNVQKFFLSYGRLDACLGHLSTIRA